MGGGIGGIGFLSGENSTVVNAYGANKRGIGLYRCYGMHCTNGAKVIQHANTFGGGLQR